HFLDVTTSTPLEPGAFTDDPCEIYDFSTEFAVDEIWSNPRVMAMTNADLLTGDVLRDKEKVRVIGKWSHFVNTRYADLYNGYVTFAEELEGLDTTLAKIGEGKGPTPPETTGLLDANGNPAAAAVTDFGTDALVTNLYDIYVSYFMGNK